MKLGKQILILALAVVFFFSFIPAKASASNAVAEGTIGQLSWWLDEKGVLRFSGDGEIPDFSSSSTAPWYDHKDEIKEVILEGVTSVGNYAFYKCTNLTKVSFSNTVTRIGSHAFYSTGLTEILLSESITTVEEYAFHYCTNVHTLVIPSSLTSISNNAFSALWGITSLEIPESVTAIGDYAFSGCKLVPSVTIPNSVTSIGNGAFQSMPELTSITIPASVQTMGFEIFKYCTKLTGVTFEGNAPQMEALIFKGVTITASYPCTGNGWKEAISSVNFAGTVTWNCVHNFVGGTCEDCGMVTGTCGDNLTWVLSADGVLTISGSGPMGDYKNGAYSDYNTNPFPWYDYKNQIKEVIIEEGVTSIDAHAFNNYDSIEKVSLPSTLTAIGTDTFLGINNLTEVSLAEGLTLIGEYMFSDCYNLSTVNIPVSLTTIGKKAFYNTALEETLELSGVATIGEMAFMSCTKLTNVVLGDSLKTIADRAFEGCTGLTELVIPDSVETIGLGAFSGCSSLQKLTVPFVGYSKTASSTAFTHHIGYIFGEGGYTGGYAADAAYANSNNTLTTKTYYIPSSLTELTVTGGELRQYALRDFKTLKTLYLGSNVSYLDNYVVQSCTALKEMYFAGNAPSFIVNTAFTGCTFDAYYPCSDATWESKITSTYGGTVTWKAAHNFVNGTCANCKASEVTIIASGTCGENLTWTLTSDGTLTISGSGAMSNSGGSPFSQYSDNIKEVIIEDGVTSIGNYAFKGCSSLKSITIPEGVTSIGLAAFSSCSGLTSITIPEGVTSIGNWAFGNCSGLTSITIPEDVTSIGSSAFYGCSGLTSITIPEGVTSIDNSAFSGCSELTSITIPEGVTSIGSSAFSSCSGLTSITIPKSVTSIGKEAFRYCSGLTSITIPDGVTSIEDYTFSGCSGLTSIEIPEGVTSIGSHAFYGCSGLTSVEIPESVTSIGNSAFFYCSLTGTLDIPASVSSIGIAAFHGNELSAIAVDPDNPYYLTDDRSVLLNKEKTQLIWVPSAITDTYEIPYGVTEIPDNVFFSCDKLTGVVIPDTVTSIGMFAFSNCDKLQSIEIPKNVTSIGMYAFAYCSSLESITFQGSAPAVASDAFNGVGKFTANYPSNLPGWTETIKNNYGATKIEWKSYIGKIDLEGATMTLSNSLSMNFVVDMDLLPGSDYYAVITRTYADGSTDTVRCDLADWQDYKENSQDNENRKYFSYHGIAAKEMIDELTVEIFNADGTSASNVWKDSPRTYALRAIEDEEASETPNTEKLALYVDMLNYGAAAQTYFGYQTDDLANKDLTDAQKAYATDSVTPENKQNSLNSGYIGASLALFNEIRLNFVFDSSIISTDMYAEATYTDHDGKPQKFTIPGTDFLTEGKNGLMVSVTGMAVADYNQAVTCTVYKADETKVIDATDSVGSYIGRALQVETHDLFKMILKFCYSAYNAFH